MKMNVRQLRSVIAEAVRSKDPADVLYYKALKSFDAWYHLVADMFENAPRSDRRALREKYAELTRIRHEITDLHQHGKLIDRSGASENWGGNEGGPHGAGRHAQSW